MTCVRAVVVLSLAACSGRSATPASTWGPAAQDPDEPSGEPASGSDAAAAPGPRGVPRVKVALGDVGLEASSLDRSADPCVDFYQFSCGGWIQNHPIPPDRARWGRGSELDERNKRAIKALLDEAAKGRGDEPARKLGNFYASCMDEAAVARAGTAPLAPLLGKTLGVRDAASWLTAVVELHRLGISVVWSNQVAADRKSSTTNVVYLDAAGLGLPDRDYYVKPELRAKLDGYQAHVARTFALIAPRGQPPAEAARAVVAIETEIARLTRTAAEQRDVAAAYNPTDLKALTRQARSVDWARYFPAVDQPIASATKKIIVGTPALFAALDKLRASFAPAQWASYFTYHLLHDLALGLPRAFDDEAFALTQLLTGVEQPRERGKRCVEATAEGLGELLGEQYVARYFPGSSKQRARELVDAIAAAMADAIAGIDWMSDATRQIALAKLAKVVRMVGYPDRWKTYDFEVTRDDLAGNLRRAAAFDQRYRRTRAGQPVDRAEWQMNAYEVDAYYDPSANNTALPAGILQSPYFAMDRAVAANLGGIGMVIGHELTHAFDDQGARFDAEGNLVDWWQPGDLAKFADKGACVAEQYATFEALPGRRIQGALTLGENIADLGGVKMAFQAYRALRQDAPRTYVADGFTEDQQFFLAVGQAWCARERPAETERRLTVDPHAPPKFRVYGSLRNLPAFAEAFRCAAGTPMRPATPCAVW